MSQRAWHRVMKSISGNEHRVTACLAPCDDLIKIEGYSMYNK